jgi:hypothetical protein
MRLRFENTVAPGNLLIARSPVGSGWTPFGIDQARAYRFATAAEPIEHEADWLAEVDPKSVFNIPEQIARPA